MLLDIWWDPAMYEQMHMQWEHKEQDALETLYSTQAWIRERIAFYLYAKSMRSHQALVQTKLTIHSIFPKP